MKRGRGRPPHEPDQKSRDIVEALAGCGIEQLKIARVLRITVPTLQLHYREELDRGMAVVESNLVGHLMRLARGNDGTALKAAMFILQCRFGWSIYLPAPSREEPLGKKEALVREAHTAHEESSWGELVKRLN